LVVLPSAAKAQQKVDPKTVKATVHSVDINSATAKDFAKLPGLGPELAKRIVDFRSKHGPFRRVEDLLAIRGIGPKKWKTLRPHLRVDTKHRAQAPSR